MKILQFINVYSELKKKQIIMTGTENLATSTKFQADSTKTKLAGTSVN